MSLAVDSSIPGGEDPGDDFAGFLDEVLDSESDADAESVQSPKRRKLEAESNGSSLISSSEVLEVENNGSLCEHLAGSYKDMCLVCGKRLDQVENESEKWELEELTVKSLGEIDQGRRNKKTRELLGDKKLHLVLDLDHTLLNTTAVACLTPREEYLLGTDHKLEGVFLVRNSAMDLVTKLRPFVGEFLEEAAEMFEMSVYTMGDRPYAQQMVKLLDPRGVFFGDRVVSRDDSTKKFEKNLDLVCAKESAVLVLDDTQGVWTEGNQKNVILMQRYLFFRSSYDSFGFKHCVSHSELKTDEIEEHTQRTYLGAILQLLKLIHGMFFDAGVAAGANVVERDVRPVLERIRSRVLKGCKIAFGCALASDAQADMWNMAEKLGAVCSKEVMDASVTHVIETDAETQNSKWAVKEGKFLVHPQWIQAASFLWQKQLEDRFSISLKLVNSKMSSVTLYHPMHDNSGHEFIISEVAATSSDYERTTKRCKTSLSDHWDNSAMSVGFIHTQGGLHLLALTKLSDLTPEEEEYLNNKTQPVKDGFKVQDSDDGMNPMIIKLRPYIRTFLKKVSGMFEMYVYEDAPRSLVWKMVGLLDPKNDCGRKRGMSLCELNNDEGGNYLADVLQHLRRIHSRFFNDRVMCDEVFNRDVRLVLESLKKISETDKLRLRKKAVSNCMWKDSINRKKMTKHMEEQSPPEASCVKNLDDPESPVVVAVADHIGPAPWVHPSWSEKSIHLWKKSHADQAITEQSKLICSSNWNTGIDNQRGNEEVDLRRPEE
ncbi:RNA polymerase II C-terminal domain phosphatase-like 4 [Argentina anserina]|uniref:RNA polymerase II C-terminal domain phosphatase-like 4 n=1 Tax=Argentina anserina TaxID=57926 RepID=UPI0021768DE4|nr:RNA polymerase II C-terminal domain phosphatase-like 4 [Potentilla anserina]